jgi:hypothetical protein
MIPGVFTGGWVRRGISLGDQPPVEDAVVWWLQAPTLHADLRVPNDGGEPLTSFAGVTTWDGTALTWTRAVDLEHYDGVDVGTVAWDGADLLESGTFEDDSGLTSYTERWVRLPGSEGPLQAMHRDEARLVRAGDYAITLDDLRSSGGPFVSTAWKRTPAGWRMHHTLPGMPLAPTPPEPEGPLEGWTVDETGGSDPD